MNDPERSRGTAFVGLTPEQVDGLNRSLRASISASLFTPEQRNSISDSIRSMTEQSFAQTMEGLRRSLRYLSNPISPSSFFSEIEEEQAAYSPKMTSAGAYFDTAAGAPINSFEELNERFSLLHSKVGNLRLVWRGVSDATWGLHSKLFRELMTLNGVGLPSENPSGPQPYPTESQLVRTEAAMIAQARDEWRLDNLGPLEILARLQHYGAPTRLLDVTRNPLIAAWFCVEFDERKEDTDGRLFAISTGPVRGVDEAPIDSKIRESDLPRTALPFWHYLESTRDRQQADWGTGALRRIWVPPAYDQRMSAQNAAFILDGVPMTSAKTAPYFTTGVKNEYWSRADLLAASSVYAKVASPSKKPLPNRPRLAPTFSWRITPQGKRNIRTVLQDRFGYTTATIYPDTAKLGSHLQETFKSYAPTLIG